MGKYMIQVVESDMVLVGNSKSKLTKAYKEAVKTMYKAYMEACQITGETVEITLNEMIQWDEIDNYDEWTVNTYKYEVETVN